MDYQTFQPRAELSDFIKCFWTLESSPQDAQVKQRIVPDGCMEMIIHYGDPYHQYLKDGSSVVQPRCFVFGQITRPLYIEPTGETSIFAIRFYPHGFLPFTTLSLTKMQNKAIALNELFGPDGTDFEMEILRAETTSKRILLAKSFLLKRLSDQVVIDKIVNESVQIILKSQGRLSVSALSDEMNVHHRNLQRKFSSVVGISPKHLAKIIRLQRVIKMLNAKHFTSLTALAYEGNYYDQAHFIKDFKELTGQSPKNFYADNLQLSALFHSSE